MAKTAFVTGATGLLGETLCRRLVDEGWEVAAVRRRSSDTSALSDLDIDWYVADVMDRAALTQAMPAGASVFHLAGLGLQQADAQTVYQVNLQGTKNVLDAAVANDAERFLFTSTAGTRGADGIADEDDVTEPVGAYQVSKREAEELVAQYVADGLDAVVVHPTSVFGAGDTKFTERLISLVRTPYMPISLPGGVSFVGVEDVADGMLAAMEHGETGEHYLLGGENLRFSEALEILAREGDGSAPPFVVPAFCIHLAGPVVGVVNDLLGTRMFPFDADMAKLSTTEMFYTSEKAKRDLGYDPTPFADLVAPAVAWYDEKHGSADESAVATRTVADGAGRADDAPPTDAGEGDSGETEGPTEPLA
jgi:dihydroflavonol-4-reductase